MSLRTHAQTGEHVENINATAGGIKQSVQQLLQGGRHETEADDTARVNRTDKSGR